MADHPGNGMHEPPSAEGTTVPSSASGGDAEGQPSANAASDLSNQQNVSQESTPPLPDTSDTDATAFATPQSQGENKTEVKADEAGHVHSPAEVRPERPVSPEIRVNGGKSAETSDPFSSSTSPQQPVPEVGASTAENVTTALDVPSSGPQTGDEVPVAMEGQAALVSQPGALERSLSDTELCASNAVKGIDLDAVFTKSLDSVAVPVGQAAAENDIAKRPHHHKGAMMRSRTVSVVSLIADRKKAAKFRLSKSQKLILFCLCLVNFTSYISYSVIAPFYPQEAAFKGMREAVSGFVFSVYALTMMIFAPIFGKLVPILGARFIFFSGILFAGGANILFGLLDMVDDTTLFTSLSFVVRILEAIGAAGFSTASYAIVLHIYPDQISTVFGIIETCVGVGMSIGPAIGGALYSVGGFGLPFYILGSCVLLTFPVCWYVMRGIQVQAVVTRKESYLTLLRVPQVIVVSVILVIGSQSQGFVEPTLEPHMRKEFGVNTSIVGSFFLVMSAIFSICSPLVGFLCMKTDQRIPIMIVGLIIMSAAQLFMGPAPFLGLPSNLWATLATVSVLGASFAFAYVPTMESMIRAAVTGGMTEDIGTYALVSGWWNSMYSLGEVIGPSAGGVLLDIIGFPWASTVVAAGSLLTALMATLYWCCASRVEPESYWHRGAASSSDSSDDDSDSAVSEPAGETTALLGKKRKDFHYSSL